MLLPKAFSSPYSSYCLMLLKFSSKGEFRLKLGQPSVCMLNWQLNTKVLYNFMCLDTFVFLISSTQNAGFSLRVCTEELSRGSIKAVSLALEIP